MVIFFYFKLRRARELDHGVRRAPFAQLIYVPRAASVEDFNGVPRDFICQLTTEDCQHP
jgi:hypothetical protein